MPFALALALFVGFWSMVLTGSLPAPHHRENQSISRTSAQCATYECRQEANEEALSDYTGMLAWFTAVLAIVSFVQGIFLWRADLASKRAYKASEAATKVSQELANKQFLLEGERADLAAKQHGLIRLQHIAANKPQLRIRSISLVSRVTGGSKYFAKGTSITGSLVVANGGSTDAKIIDSGYRFYWSKDGLPMQPPIDGADVTPLLLTEDPIVGYGSRSVTVQSREVLPEIPNSFHTGIALGWTLYLMGFIHYADVNGAERFMGFCRRYDHPVDSGSQGRFVAVENPDYEYQD